MNWLAKAGVGVLAVALVLFLAPMLSDGGSAGDDAFTIGLAIAGAVLLVVGLVWDPDKRLS